MCRGLCAYYAADSMENGMRYERGQKRCTYCAVFLSTDGIRCPCCSTILRTRPRRGRPMLLRS